MKNKYTKLTIAYPPIEGEQNSETFEVGKNGVVEVNCADVEAGTDFCSVKMESGEVTVYSRMPYSIVSTPQE